MLAKTRGIVLKTINYSETSVVAKIYTEQFGLKSYLIHGVRKRKAKTKANSLQLLSLLDLEVYNRENREMQHIKEIRTDYIFQHLPYDIKKSSIAMFVNELLYNSLREEEANNSMFEFLYHSIQMLDILTEHFSSFHLHFAIQLSKYLGFGPDESSYKTDALFDLADGKFHPNQRTGIYSLNKEESAFFYHASAMSFDSFNQLSLSKHFRKSLLESILRYYQFHLPEFKALHSHEVLETVLA